MNCIWLPSHLPSTRAIRPLCLPKASPTPAARIMARSSACQPLHQSWSPPCHWTPFLIMYLPLMPSSSGEYWVELSALFIRPKRPTLVRLDDSTHKLKPWNVTLSITSSPILTAPRAISQTLAEPLASTFWDSTKPQFLSNGSTSSMTNVWLGSASTSKQERCPTLSTYSLHHPTTLIIHLSHCLAGSEPCLWVLHHNITCFRKRLCSWTTGPF